MNGRMLKFKRYSKTVSMSLIICAALFFSGVLFGVFTADSVSPDDAVYDSIRSYISASAAGTADRPDFLKLFFDTAKYHALAFIFGFSLIGAVSIPLLSVLRGFSLAFSIALIAKITGLHGFCFILVFFGLEALVSLPCFLIISRYSLEASLGLVKTVISHDMSGTAYRRNYFFRYAVCMAILLISALAQKTLILYFSEKAAGLI